MVFERHGLKGAKEQGFSEVLSGLDFHHPPCKDLMANQAFYAIAMLACNVLLSLKMPGEWLFRTPISSTQEPSHQSAGLRCSLAKDSGALHNLVVSIEVDVNSFAACRLWF
jgi:hypothetical protein